MYFVFFQMSGSFSFPPFPFSFFLRKAGRRSRSSCSLLPASPCSIPSACSASKKKELLPLPAPSSCLREQAEGSASPASSFLALIRSSAAVRKR
uniref:hypothetical protein 19 n=1 Tax=Moniliophthora perniciosa TaxID=153609 RepID=UPI0000242353|nr:hypothetical protein 19 [Moniliophthora perniciosa]AAQ74309.1 hypothetical protein 19 [Moniliophthora perniciosa]